MKQFFVEGLVIPAQKKGRAKGKSEVEPFSGSFWANSADEALRMAREELPGAEWVEGPRLARQSEEQRMRKIGAPELFSASTIKKSTQRKTKS